MTLEETQVSTRAWRTCWRVQSRLRSTTQLRCLAGMDCCLWKGVHLRWLLITLVVIPLRCRTSSNRAFSPALARRSRQLTPSHLSSGLMKGWKSACVKLRVTSLNTVLTPSSAALSTFLGSSRRAPTSAVLGTTRARPSGRRSVRSFPVPRALRVTYARLATDGPKKNKDHVA